MKQTVTESVTSELREAAALAVESIRSQPARSTLAIIGVVIGIVTVVLVSSTLVGLRNSVAQLFRELGTDTQTAPFSVVGVGDTGSGCQRGAYAQAQRAGAEP